jgi:hypothetical protein
LGTVPILLAVVGVGSVVVVVLLCSFPTTRAADFNRRAEGEPVASVGAECIEHFERRVPV